jgi:hypothetical protein
MRDRNSWIALADRAVAERVRFARAQFPGETPGTFADAVAAAEVAGQAEKLIARLERHTASGDIVHFRRVSRLRREIRDLAAALAGAAGSVDDAPPTEATPIPDQPSDPK